MTKWKQEKSTTLRVMHEHNQYSRWHGYVIRAAEEMGLLVGYREYSNYYDGSRSREWYVMSDQLDAVGGLNAVHELANRAAQEDDVAAAVAA